jgi:gas vesicle protein
MALFNNHQNTEDQHHSSHVDMSFWVGMFIGGLIGAALIVLLGTDKGKKLAKQLQEEGLDLWDDTRDKIDLKKEDLIEKAVKVKDIITEKALDAKEETVEQVTMKVEALEERSNELIEKGKELIEKGKELEVAAVEKLEETKEKIADSALDAANESLAHIEELQERGRATTAELRQRLFKNIPKKTS